MEKQHKSQGETIPVAHGDGVVFPPASVAVISAQFLGMTPLASCLLRACRQQASRKLDPPEKKRIMRRNWILWDVGLRTPDALSETFGRMVPKKCIVHARQGIGSSEKRLCRSCSIFPSIPLRTIPRHKGSKVQPFYREHIHLFTR